MSLFNTLRTGASGLSVSGASLGVIGDNIANLNTTGYKRNRANFADMLPSGAFGMSGPQQMGRGAALNSISTQYSQGALQGSGSSLDIAISGQGFFQVNSGDESFYTRDGAFGLDVDGFMVTPGGYRLQGYGASDGVVSPVVGDLHIDQTPLPPQVTTEITLSMSFQPQKPDSTTGLYTSNLANAQAAGLDGTGVDINTLTDNVGESTSVTIYDSLGQPHDAVVVFEQTAEDTWSYSMVIDGGETDVPGAVDGAALEVMSGTMTFDTDGALTGVTQTVSGAAWSWPGAAPWTPSLDLGLDPVTGEKTDGAANNSATATTTNSVSQDGFAQGTLDNLMVDDEGQILGRYTNGEEIVLGQVAIATFDAEGGLERSGGNMYRATLASGDPALGAAGSGSRGGTVGYALERSNVDLEQEFVDMIQAQRSYQANAGVVTAADETLQALVQLV
jgi:flagellar hook protein FlgE